MHLLSLLAQAPAPVDNGGGAGLLVGGGLLLVALVIGLLVLVFWLWALIDAIRNPALSDNERTSLAAKEVLPGPLPSVAAAGSLARHREA